MLHVRIYSYYTVYIAIIMLYMHTMAVHSNSMSSTTLYACIDGNMVLHSVVMLVIIIHGYLVTTMHSSPSNALIDSHTSTRAWW